MKRKNNKNNKVLDERVILNYILIIILLLLFLLFFGYFYLIDEKKEVKQVNKEIVYEEDNFEEKDLVYIKTDTDIDINKLLNTINIKSTKQHITKEKDKLSFHINLPKDEKDFKIIDTKDNNIKKNIKTKKYDEFIKDVVIVTKKISNKPKLILIIDDITNKKQINFLKSLPFKVNISILPPSKGHFYSKNIAKGLKHYLVHLPLEAFNFPNEEDNTLHIQDSYNKIYNRIKYIRQIYPEAKFINNHTGSKFTSTHKSMDRLMKALNKFNFGFLDSLTSPKSVAYIYAKKYKVPFLIRNIFLDNYQNYNYIKSQLKKAVLLAKHTGFAIAIGHPHNETFKVLKDSKYLFKDVELVFIDKYKK